jgi:hypothetical protein
MPGSPDFSNLNTPDLMALSAQMFAEAAKRSQPDEQSDCGRKRRWGGWPDKN